MSEALLLLAWGLAQHALWEYEYLLELRAELERLKAKSEALKDSFKLAILLNASTDIAEEAYRHLREQLTPVSRRILADHISTTRKVLADYVGPPPFIVHMHIPGDTWPYVDGKEGKVQRG